MAAKSEAGAVGEKEKMVKIKLFKDKEKYKDDVFVGVNGRTWLIQRGVEVEVPECVAEVLANAERQRKQAEERMEMIIQE